MEPIKTTFKGKQVIKLKSGETISLIELPKPGISSTQTVVRIDKSRLTSGSVLSVYNLDMHEVPANHVIP